MERRVDIWRAHLMGKNVEHKRHLYHTFINGTNDCSESTRTTIDADMPRTYPNQETITAQTVKIKQILIEYASLHKGDSYLQGFNYMVAILLDVFKDEDEHMADVWWCFSAVVGRIRPFIPSFYMSLFQCFRIHFMFYFHYLLNKKIPILAHLLQCPSETISPLLPS